MFGRRKDKTPEAPLAPATPPAPGPEVIAEPTQRDATGTVTRKAQSLSSSSSYTNLAVLFDGEGETAPFVLTGNTSSVQASLAEIGEKVICKLYRPDANTPWRLHSVELIFDIEKERRKAEAAARDH